MFEWHLWPNVIQMSFNLVILEINNFKLRDFWMVFGVGISYKNSEYSSYKITKSVIGINR